MKPTEPKKALSPEEKRCRIAKACGWRWVYVAEIAAQNRWLPPGSNEPSDSVAIPPDYLGDLNAIHEAEKMLNRKQSAIYRYCLMLLSDGPKRTFDTVEAALCHATAAQRADAFLAAISTRAGEGEG